MTDEELQRRLNQYGDTLERHLHGSVEKLDTSRVSSASRTKYVAGIAAVVLVLGFGSLVVVSFQNNLGADVAVVATRSDEKDVSGQLSDSPRPMPLPVQSPEAGQCMQAYESGQQFLEEPIDQTLGSLAESPTLVGPTTGERFVIVGGETDVAVCQILEEGGLFMWDGERGPSPSADGIQIGPFTGGSGVTNGPTVLRLVGRAGNEIVAASVRVTEQTAPAVISGEWVLFEVLLEGSLADIDQVWVDWETSDGRQLSKAVLEYRADMATFLLLE